MESVKISSVTILYNNNSDVIKHNIITYSTYLSRLYLIDNSTKDNSIMLNIDKKIKYISNKKNLGIAKALNIACENAISDGFKYLLTMDQDSSFSENNLENYLNCVNENLNDNIAVYSLNSKNRVKNIKTISKKEEVLTAITSGSIINLNIYKKLNGFSNKLFIDEVDNDYCLKANKLGYKVIRFPNIYLEHNLGEPEKIFWKISHKTHNPLRYYYMTRNNLYIWKKYYKTFPIYISKVILLFIRKILVILLIEKQKKEKFYYFKRGIKDFINNKYGELEK